MVVFKHLTGTKEAVEAYTVKVTEVDENLIPDPIPHPKDENLWRTVLVDGFDPLDLTQVDELSTDWFQGQEI